ncbi:MAG: penicillin-binding protein 2 [Gammaproteobacteria bacterium 28-57-27]|nr:MAG: penicillin-binding protein 2 [Gammaproteobacteria bacterium 28-57-27]
MEDEARVRDILLRRAIFAGLVCFFVLAGVVARVVWLQVTAHEHFTELAEKNRTRSEPIPPSRGLIYDRNGVLLADNTPSFQVELVPEQVKDMDATLALLTEILGLDEDELDRFRKALKNGRPFDSIPLKFNLSELDIARLAVERPRLPGVEVQARLTRIYPQAGLTAHAVGYVGRISEREMETIDREAYEGTSHIGKTGLERFYEDRLRGKVGSRKLEVDAHGRSLRILEETPATPGEDLHLSLDVRLQAAAEAALGDFLGAIVALDPRNGEVLAFVSRPTFDPNLFVNGIRSKDYRALMDNPDRPLFNRALSAAYPPGSTVKPMMGLAGLEYGLITPEYRMFAGPYYQLPNDDHHYRDWRKGGHGWVDLDHAIAQSCDVYFYDLAYRMGIDRLHDFALNFGLGRVTGVDLPSEVAGLVPSKDWKRATKKQAWYPGETLIAGIGQGFMLSTPLQLAQMTATLAQRGASYRPHLWRDAPPEALPVIKLSKASFWDAALGGMEHVVNADYGTAKRIKNAPYLIAGKSGTAQVFTVKQNETYNAKGLNKKLLDHAVFIAFAPVDAPRIAVAAFVEHGSSGSGVAAPMTRKVMDAWLLGETLDKNAVTLDAVTTGGRE